MRILYLLLFCLMFASQAAACQLKEGEDCCRNGDIQCCRIQWYGCLVCFNRNEILNCSISTQANSSAKQLSSGQCSGSCCDHKYYMENLNISLPEAFHYCIERNQGSTMYYFTEALAVFLVPSCLGFIFAAIQYECFLRLRRFIKNLGMSFYYYLSALPLLAVMANIEAVSMSRISIPEADNGEPGRVRRNSISY